MFYLIRMYAVPTPSQKQCLNVLGVMRRTCDPALEQLLVWLQWRDKTGQFLGHLLGCKVVVDTRNMEDEHSTWSGSFWRKMENSLLVLKHSNSADKEYW